MNWFKRKTAETDSIKNPNVSHDRHVMPGDSPPRDELWLTVHARLPESRVRELMKEADARRMGFGRFLSGVLQLATIRQIDAPPLDVEATVGDEVTVA